MECGVYSVECGVLSVGCKVWSVELECDMWSVGVVERKVSSVSSVKCGV